MAVVGNINGVQAVETDYEDRGMTMGQTLQKLEEYDKGEEYQNVGDTRNEMAKTMVREFNELVAENLWRVEPWYICMWLEKDCISARAIKMLLIARATEPKMSPNWTCYKYYPARSSKDNLELLWTVPSATERQFFLDHQDMFHPQIIDGIKKCDQQQFL